MCAYASWSRETWLNQKSVLLHNAADWVAWMAGKYGIPIKALSNADAQNPNVKGVCQHVNLGSMGGNHHDAGSGFPMDKVLELARRQQRRRRRHITNTGGRYGGMRSRFTRASSISPMLARAAGMRQRRGHRRIERQERRDDRDRPGERPQGRQLHEHVGKFCTYTQAKGASGWTWTDKKWPAK